MFLPLAYEKTELIEVVRVTDPVATDTAEDLIGDDVAIWEAGAVRDALALIAEVPDGELYRCFVPGWGIRAHSATGLLFRVAFCFRCHGARLWGPDVPAAQTGVHTFDADSTEAQELLQRFRASAPDVSNPRPGW